MSKGTIKLFQSRFRNYVAGFYSQGKDEENDWAIKLKEKHSQRVRKEISELGKKLGLKEHDILISEVLGLFHDIGRFPQFRRYKTYRDDLSENHAHLGVKAIAETGILKDLPGQEENLIKKSIFYHNAYQLPEKEDPRCLFFCRMLRDADKLDIWRVLISHYKHRDDKPNPVLEYGLKDTAGFSNELIEDLVSGRVANAKSIKNLNDFKLLQISWVYDINFYPTFQKISAHRYIEDIVSTLSQTNALKSALNSVKNHVAINQKGYESHDPRLHHIRFAKTS